MKLIVGLGNPALRQDFDGESFDPELKTEGLSRTAQGKDKYSGTRHNLGFMVVDELVKKMDGGGWKLDKKFKAESLKIGDILLVKPQTYMNNSGMAVKLISSYYHLVATDIIIIHDDLDLLLGKIKVRTGGAAAGHHGVESIINAIGDGFTRVRVGIGNDRSHSGEHERVHFDAESFVLDSFEPQEKPAVRHAIKQAVELLLAQKWLTDISA